MLRKLLAVAIFLVTSAFACEVLPPRPPEPEDPTAYPPSSYAAPEGGDTGTPCEVACRHLAALHCPEGEPTKSGVKCPDLCARAQALEDLPTSCLADASTVAAVRACGVRCNP